MRDSWHDGSEGYYDEATGAWEDAVPGGGGGYPDEAPLEGGQGGYYDEAGTWVDVAANGSLGAAAGLE